MVNLNDFKPGDQAVLRNGMRCSNVLPNPHCSIYRWQIADNDGDIRTYTDDGFVNRIMPRHAFDVVDVIKRTEILAAPGIMGELRQLRDELKQLRAALQPAVARQRHASPAGVDLRLAESGDIVTLRNGRKARLLACSSDHYPWRVLALDDGSQLATVSRFGHTLICHTPDGRYTTGTDGHPFDIMAIEDPQPGV